MKEHHQHSRFMEVLLIWQNLSRSFHQRPVSLPSWEPADRLVQSALLLDDYARQHLQEALDRSDAYLAPLREPLRLNLGTHRWLSADREESYSDWLAWILQGMNDAAEILPLFGHLDKENIDALGAVARILREHQIKDGRTDIEVWWSEARALLLIEVKVEPTGSDLVGQLTGYAKWAAEQPAGQRLQILVALKEPEQNIELTGFKFVGWKDLCVRMRRSAERFKSMDPMRAAAVLIFCAAVEQNLLDLSAMPPRFHAMATVDYLKSWRRES